MSKKTKKNNFSKKDLEKFEFGTTVENPNSTLAKNNIMIANSMSKANKNGLTTGLDIFGTLAQQIGGSLMQQGTIDKDSSGIEKFLFNNGDTTSSILGFLSQFENGGTVGERVVEVEGNEVAETPDNTLLEFKGPSHEEGGIPVSLPVGTEVYSDSIEIDGKTMAQRKKIRDKKETRAKDVYDKSGDKISKNTLERILYANKVEEEKDTLTQDYINSLEEDNEQFAYGGPVTPLNIQRSEMIMPESGQYFPGIMNMPRVDFNRVIGPDDFIIDDNEIELAPATVTAKRGINSPMVTPTEMGQPSPINYNLNNFEQPNVPGIPSQNTLDQNSTLLPTNENGDGFNFPSLDNLFGTMTSGDVMGLMGNYMQVKGANDYTLAERGANLPNRRFYDEYGKDTLNTLEGTKVSARNSLEQLNRDIDLDRASAIKRNSGSARGLNTIRALNIATDTAVNNSRNQSYDNFMRLIAGIDGQIANTELNIDDMQARDAMQEHLANQQDIAAFYENMKTNAINKGKLVTSFGEAKNKWQQDATISKALESIFPNFKGNMKTGDITGVSSQDDDFEFTTPDYEQGNNSLNDIGILRNIQSIYGDNSNVKVKKKSSPKTKKKK